jgi:Putative zinc-finger
MVRAKRKKKRRPPTEQIVTCEDAIALIADYLSSSLSSRVLRTFEEHLQGCRDCTAFLQTYKKTIEVTRSFFRVEVSDKPRKPALRVPNGDGNLH